MFDPLFDAVTWVLAQFYSLWPSYGMAIAFLTLTAMVAVTPLTLKSTRSMLQMQQHMPELKKIQNQHKGDREAMNAATMAFYKERGINPAGCLLPMLVQGPIFLVMYRVVHGLTRRTTEIGTQLGFTSRRYADGEFGQAAEYANTPIARGELAFDPDFLARDTDLYSDLSGNLEMVSWGVDLSRSASEALSDGIIGALPYFLMILIVLVTALYQQRQIQGRQNQSAMPPQQQMMMKIIPYMLPVFSYVIPAAVVIYFIVSNLVRIAQQAYITRSFYRGEDSLGAQVAKQRAAGTSTDTETKPRPSKSVTERKGAPTPRRDGKPARKAPSRAKSAGASTSTRGKAPSRGRTSSPGRAPSRRRTSSAATTPARRRTSPENRPSGKGKTGKAPARGGRGGRGGGRVTPRGSSPKHQSQNRSRSKRKRR